MKWLFILLLLPLLLAAGALIANRPPLMDAPGPVARLKLYLTTHVAQTRLEHELAELRPLRLALSEGAAKALVVDAMRQLQWTEISAEGGVVRALVRTRWLHFKDDVEVHLERDGTGTLVQVKSASRVGKGDFAANTRHILDLFEILRLATAAQQQ